ncbi:MAG: RNA polymerase sigma factor [Patescibacteria group bacterium]|jgi:RNA polymerase sigma-70 factor (ECF subfamily)
MPSNIVKKFKNKQTLSRLKSRDKEVFTEVYDANVADIHRFVYFKIGSREEANDLTSIIFLKTWDHIQKNTLEDAKTLRALLYKVARNAIIDYYRERGSQKPISLDDEQNPVDIATDMSQSDKIDDDQDLKRIISKLPFLKEEYREIIIMRFINDLSLEEISDISQKSRGNVRVLLHRALTALRELIEDSPGV